MSTKDFLKNPWTLLLLGLFVVNIVVYILYSNYDGWGDIATITYCLMPAAASGVIFMVYSFYGRAGVEGKVWLFMGIGMALWTAGEVAWVAYDLAGQDPFPSLADALFLIAYLPIIYAVVSKARYTPVKSRGRNNMIIIAIMALIVLPTLIYVFEPIITDTYYDETTKAVSLAYPALDLVLLAYALFIAVYWGPTVSKGWYILAAAMIFMTLADISYAALEWKGIWITYMDLLWTASYMLFGLGAYYQMKHHESFM